MYEDMLCGFIVVAHLGKNLTKERCLFSGVNKVICLVCF